MHNHKHRNLIIGSIIIASVITGLSIYLLARHPANYSTTPVAYRDLTSTVRSNGTVVADQASSLSFSSSGKIQDVRVHVGDIVHKGDILATLDTGTIRAQLDGAMADAAAAEAQLSKIEQGARPEEVALYSQKYNDASSALIVAMNNAYLQTSDAILNKADGIFTNGNSVNPIINVRTQSQTEYSNINQERLMLTDKLNSWKNLLYTVSSSSIDQARTSSKTAMSVAQTFLSDLGSITNNLSIGNSGMSQTSINADMALINGANQELTGAYNSFTTADASWSVARDSLSLENAGSREQDIAVGSAQLSKAQAQVEGYRSALALSYIVAPFDGTITDVNMKIGEVVVPGFSANQNIYIINTGLYNIETYVPENAIGALNVGNPAKITMDAYGSGVIFPATVFLVSPAETVINKVNSYKVILRFDQPDTRIRSGLTINALITTATTTGSLSVPTRSIITNMNDKYVLLEKTDGTYIQQPVTTGITSTDGFTEILSGLSEGNKVANL